MGAWWYWSGVAPVLLATGHYALVAVVGVRAGAQYMGDISRDEREGIRLASIFV